MGLFGKSDDSTQSGSLWNRLTKNHRKQEQKSNGNNSISNSQNTARQTNKEPTKTEIKVFEASKKENFRLSLQSLHSRPTNSPNQFQQFYRTSCTGAEQLNSRLRTSKLQCEQLKKKVATISLECNKLESQCRELKEVKEHLLSFQSDITMLKRKEKVTSDVQQRLNVLDEENSIMRDQIEKLRIKVSDLDSEIDPEIINKRLDQLEADSHQLTSITLQNRRDHDSFSLDVGNQLVETFITQQTIYEEFRRLQHRLVSVERQNQIMADLIHFHCHNSIRGIISRPMTNSDSSRGPLSMQASMEAASSSLSPPSSDREAEKINTSPSNIDWQLTDQSDSLFLCDTLNKSSEPLQDTLNFDIKNKDYYKIDFTTNSGSLGTFPMNDLSVGSLGSAEETSDRISMPSHIIEDCCNTKNIINSKNDSKSVLINQCTCFKYQTMSNSRQTSCQKDDGYYSTSHDGTMNIKEAMLKICETTFRPVTIFLDKKERYFILTKHLQKSHGRSKRIFAVLKTNLSFIVTYSVDLETKIYNRNVRQKQHKQRESHLTENEEESQVFSDTELYGTRFCIDSDLEDDELPSLFAQNKVNPTKRPFNNGHSNKSLKTDSRHIAYLPPLIEHVSERERKVEIKSSKQSRIVPPRVRPKSSNICISNTQKFNETKKSKDDPIIPKSDTQTRLSHKSVISGNNNSQEIVNKKPPKGILSPKSYKTKAGDSFSSSSNSKLPQNPTITNEISKPPPIPPRPKKKTETYCQCFYEKDLTSLDYVNEAQIRTSPEGCQDANLSRRKLRKKYSGMDKDSKLMSKFSAPVDEYYIEEDVDDKTEHMSEFDDYFDQEFMSELENYQLPKSSVNMLVLQHFK